MKNEQISWDAFAVFLTGIEGRRGLGSLISDGDIESESEAGADDISSIPIEPLGCTVILVPVAVVEGEDVEPAMKQLCETHGLQFLSTQHIGEFCESLVVVAGTDHDTERKVESLLDGCDVDWDAFKSEIDRPSPGRESPERGCGGLKVQDSRYLGADLR